MTDKDLLEELIYKANFDVVGIDEEELAQTIIDAGFRRSDEPQE